MKNRLTLWGLIAVIASAILTGCGKKDDDGPQLSDEELLNRGKAGHDAAAGKGDGKKEGPPPGVPGSPDQLNGGGRH